MNRLFKTLLLALLIPVCTYASGWNDEEYKRIEQSIQLPKLEATAKKYDISKFGAKVTNSAAQPESHQPPHRPRIQEGRRKGYHS